MSGFVERENKRGQERTHYCNVMAAMSPEHVPVITAIAKEFGLLERLFLYPGPTWGLMMCSAVFS